MPVAVGATSGVDIYAAAWNTPRTAPKQTKSIAAAGGNEGRS